jgi:hypothetical protein
VTETYQGVIKEIGGVELSKSGEHEKPRKVVISDSPDYAGKTFRIWGNADGFSELRVGEPVTVEYEVQERQGGPSGSFKQNMISTIHPNGGSGSGGESANGSSSVWGSAPPAPEAATPQADWSVPGSGTKTPPETDYDRREREKQARIEARQAFLDQRDDARTLQIESAWAIEAVLSREETDKRMTPDEIIEKALQLVILKRRLASELGS